MRLCLGQGNCLFGGDFLFKGKWILIEFTGMINYLSFVLFIPLTKGFLQ